MRKFIKATGTGLLAGIILMLVLFAVNYDIYREKQMEDENAILSEISETEEKPEKTTGLTLAEVTDGKSKTAVKAINNDGEKRNFHAYLNSTYDVVTVGETLNFTKKEKIFLYDKSGKQLSSFYALKDANGNIYIKYGGELYLMREPAKSDVLSQQEKLSASC